MECTGPSRCLLHSRCMLCGLLVLQHSHLSMLLIIMLQKLTQMPKLLITLIAMIRIIGSGSITIPSIGQHGRTSHIRLHRPLRSSKLVDIITCIVSSFTTRAISRLYMLHSIGSRTKPTISTNWTGNISRSMYLHMHI